MKEFLAICALLALPTLSRATTIPANEWQILMQKIVDYGQQFGYGSFTIRAVEHTPGDKKVPHHSEYLGPTDWVSEDWKIGDDGRWRIEQWLYRHGLAGQLENCTHTFLMKDRDVETGLGARWDNVSHQCDDAALAKHEELKQFWLNYVGKKQPAPPVIEQETGLVPAAINNCCSGQNELCYHWTGTYCAHPFPYAGCTLQYPWCS